MYLTMYNTLTNCPMPICPQHLPILPQSLNQLAPTVYQLAPTFYQFAQTFYGKTPLPQFYVVMNLPQLLYCYQIAPMFHLITNIKQAGILLKKCGSIGNIIKALGRAGILVKWGWGGGRLGKKYLCWVRVGPSHFTNSVSSVDGGKIE
jgi:hypothetical protein